jgi:hypothetical protein
VYLLNFCYISVFHVLDHYAKPAPYPEPFADEPVNVPAFSCLLYDAGLQCDSHQKQPTEPTALTGSQFHALHNFFNI